MIPNLNWLIHMAFARQDYKYCNEVIEYQFTETYDHEYLYYIKVNDVILCCIAYWTNDTHTDKHRHPNNKHHWYICVCVCVWREWKVEHKQKTKTINQNSREKKILNIQQAIGESTHASPVCLYGWRHIIIISISITILFTIRHAMFLSCFLESVEKLIYSNLTCICTHIHQTPTIHRFGSHINRIDSKWNWFIFGWCYTKLTVHKILCLYVCVEHHGSVTIVNGYTYIFK